MSVTGGLGAFPRYLSHNSSARPWLSSFLCHLRRLAICFESTSKPSSSLHFFESVVSELAAQAKQGDMPVIGSYSYHGYLVLHFRELALFRNSAMLLILSILLLFLSIPATVAQLGHFNSTVMIIHAFPSEPTR